MKINKAKLLVGTLAIASVAATVGSISGTVAWFQYNTRATVEYQGTTVHCTESLQVSVDKNTWGQTLTPSAITKTVLGRNTMAENELVPVTSGALALDKAPVDLYTNPIYQYAGDYPTTAGAGNAYWGLAGKEDYVEFPVYLRVLDVNGETSATYLQKNVYLSDVTIAAKSGDADMSSAVRVAIYTGRVETGTASIGTPYGTYANADLSTTGTPVSGNLDLNNDGVLDTAQKYSFETAGTALTYGTSGAVAKAYGPADLATDPTATEATHKIAKDTDPYNIKGKALGTTTTADPWFAITVRIYVEGWSELDGTTFGATNNATKTKVWDVAKTKAVKFNVGLRFSAETHDPHAAPAAPVTPGTGS